MARLRVLLAALYRNKALVRSVGTTGVLLAVPLVAQTKKFNDCDAEDRSDWYNDIQTQHGPWINRPTAALPLFRPLSGSDRSLQSFDASDPNDASNAQAFHKEDKYDTSGGSWDGEGAAAAKADPWAREPRGSSSRPLPVPPVPASSHVSQRKPESLEETLARAVEEAYGGAPRQGADAVPPPAAQGGSPRTLQERFQRRYGAGPSAASDGVKTVAPLLLANGLVFVGWQLPSASVRAFLERNFLTSPVHIASRPAPWGFLTNLWSTYSHSSFLHLAFNMMGLWSFGPQLMESRWHSVQAPALSVASFLAMYHTAGVLGSLGSNAFTAACGASRPGLGASGAIFGVIAYYAACHPTNGVSVMLVIHTDASTAMWGATAVNIGLSAAQWAAARKGRLGPPVDGMAHLVGTAVGVGWYYAARAAARSGGAPDKPTRRAVPKLAPQQQAAQGLRVGQPAPGQGVQV